MIVGDGIVLGAGGEKASIFVTGVEQTDTVTCIKNGRSYKGTWITSKVCRPYSVPVMTSNTVPEGVASASNESLGSAFKAFDGDDSLASSWQSGYGVSPPQWVQYKFPRSIQISAVMLKNATDSSYSTTSQGYISVSDDGTNFNTVKTFSGLVAGTLHTLTLDEPVTTQYLRVTLTAYNNTYSNKNCRLCVVQVDGLVNETVEGFKFEVDKYGTYTITATDGTNTVTQDVLVDSAMKYNIEMKYPTYISETPDMTSNTTPSGLCSASVNTGYAWKAFRYATGESDGVRLGWPSYVQYNLAEGTRIKLRKVRFLNPNDASYDTTSVGYISVSENGETFTNVYDFSLGSATVHTIDLGATHDVCAFRVNLTMYNNTYGDKDCRFNCIKGYAES